MVTRRGRLGNIRKSSRGDLRKALWLIGANVGHDRVRHRLASRWCRLVWDMTVGTCGLEQYPLGVSLSGVETNESGKTSSGLPTIVHVVSWIESTGDASTEVVE